MSTVADNLMADDLTQEMLTDMERHGITRYPIYHFRCGQYTYSNLRDAIAQAEREDVNG